MSWFWMIFILFLGICSFAYKWKELEDKENPLIIYGPYQPNLIPPLKSASSASTVNSDCIDKQLVDESISLLKEMGYTVTEAKPLVMKAINEYECTTVDDVLNKVLKLTDI